MDANMKKRNELLAKTVIKGLESRNMSGYYAQDKEVALKQALELIPNGSTIAMGGCMSAHEIGLVKALQEGEYNYIDRAKLEPREGLMAAYDADFFLSSANAVTDDGVLSILTAIPTVYPALPRARKSNLYCRYKQSLSGS